MSRVEAVELATAEGIGWVSRAQLSVSYRHTALPPGAISLGGPIVTAGGLVFIAGTADPYIRAFDLDSGKELWKARLPAPGAATPMTYQAPGGRQFLVIAAGGHAKITEEPQSDALLAFALP